MTVINKTNKNYKRSQCGRSMVEMLGVLSIIGVLSVGGISAYTTAMEKHKANQLLHEASMQASIISAQILTDKPLNVQDFGNGKYGTFSDITQPNDEQFKMQITGMDSAVCEQMEKMAGGMVRKAECNGSTLTLTYNNNLSSDKVAADYNGDETGEECTDAGYKWCSGLSTSACKKDCCSGYDSQCCDSDTGDISSTDSCTTFDGKTTTCSNGKCEFGTKDCTDEECCKSIGGDWANNISGEYFICCSDGTAICPDFHSECLCVPNESGYTSKCSTDFCVVCSESEGIAVCAGENGECSCCSSGIQDYSTGSCVEQISVTSCASCSVSAVQVGQYDIEHICMKDNKICKGCYEIGYPGGVGACAGTLEEAKEFCKEWTVEDMYCSDANSSGNTFQCSCQYFPQEYNGNKSGCENAGYKYCDGVGACIELNTECSCSEVPDCYKCDTNTGYPIIDYAKAEAGVSCVIDGSEGTCGYGGCTPIRDCTPVYGPGSQDCVKSLEEASEWCADTLGSWGCTSAEEYSDGTYGCVC
ncbi:MAG: hypothetical protein E7021_01325 [Alphaproteobacteria bacterium]|nr:hypothetical protein [Alphaproteobacteria bacterium]